MAWIAEVIEWKQEPQGMDPVTIARYGPFDDEQSAATYARDRCDEYIALHGQEAEDGKPRFTDYWYEDPIFKPVREAAECSRVPQVGG